MPSVLLIEDDAQIRKFLRISLGANGFTVDEAVRGEEALERCAAEPPDIVVLDLGLPDMDGRHVIGRLREWSRVPIIVLSARSDEAEKIAALDAGANDYVTKPFSIGEMMARLRALLRASPSVNDREARFVCGGLEVDLARRRVFLDGVELSLSRKEYELLKLFAEHAGKVLTHQFVLREVWGASHTDDTHYLRVLIGHLRRKLGDEPARPRYIHTVPGVGYRLGERG